VILRVFHESRVPAECASETLALLMHEMLVIIGRDLWPHSKEYRPPSSPMDYAMWDVIPQRV